jgi:hypothetical protein
MRGSARREHHAGVRAPAPRIHGARCPQQDGIDEPHRRDDVGEHHPEAGISDQEDLRALPDPEPDQRQRQQAQRRDRAAEADDGSRHALEPGARTDDQAKRQGQDHGQQEPPEDAGKGCAEMVQKRLADRHAVARQLQRTRRKPARRGKQQASKPTLRDGVLPEPEKQNESHERHGPRHPPESTLAAHPSAPSGRTRSPRRAAPGRWRRASAAAARGSRAPGRCGRGGAPGRRSGPPASGPPRSSG